jgi:hypothetical protein
MAQFFKRIPFEETPLARLAGSVNHPNTAAKPALAPGGSFPIHPDLFALTDFSLVYVTYSSVAAKHPDL